MPDQTPQSGVLRGVAITVIDLPKEGEAWPAGITVLARATVEALCWAMDVIISNKDRDLPGMEILAAKLGAPGVMDQVAQMKRRRELLSNHLKVMRQKLSELDQPAAACPVISINTLADAFRVVTKP